MHLDGERHCECKLFRPKTEHKDPSQGSNLDNLIQNLGSYIVTIKLSIKPPKDIWEPQTNIRELPWLDMHPALVYHNFSICFLYVWILSL